MLKYTITGAMFAAIGAGSMAAADSHGDADAGQKEFRRCASCHMAGDDAVNRVGPVLTDIVGASAGAIEGFRYSNAFKAAHDDGLVWTEAALDAFLTNPREYLPGNRMSFRGLSDADDRANLIAYLRAFQAGAATETAGFTVAPEVLAIVGDVEYGEYLGSECKTCHQTSGSDDGIPSIVGLPTEDFATAMHAYREKFRENPVMQIVAGRLDDEEIAALAAYFGDLED